MRKLMSLVTLLAIASLGWGAYWFVGATAMERELGDWLEKRRASGWVAEAASLETRGFPNRFDTTFADMQLADPGTLVSWSAPVFQLLQLSYKPTHMIAVWPDTQRLGLPGQDITLTSTGMVGSFKVTPDRSLPIEAGTIQTDTAKLVSSAGWDAGIEAGQLSMRLSPAPIAAHSYDIFFQAQTLTPSTATLKRLNRRVDLPETVELLRVSGTAAFDKPWDRSAIETGRPQPRQIRIDDITARWGQLALQASGALEVGAQGVARGEIAVQATNWRDIVAVLQASGRIEPDQARALSRALELVAGLKGDPETLDVTLRLERGWLNIGPVPVMPAPKIALP